MLWVPPSLSRVARQPRSATSRLLPQRRPEAQFLVPCRPTQSAVATRGFLNEPKLKKTKYLVPQPHLPLFKGSVARVAQAATRAVLGEGQWHLVPLPALLWADWAGGGAQGCQEVQGGKQEDMVTVRTPPSGPRDAPVNGAARGQAAERRD